MGLGGFAPLPLRLGGSSTEGWSPEAHARAAADLVAMKRTVPLLKMTFTTANPSAPTIHGFSGVIGVGSAFFPDLITVMGVGDVMFGWTSRRWTDAYEVSHPFHFHHGRAGFHGSTAAFCTVECLVWQVRVHCFLHNSAPQDGKITLRVW